MTEMAEIDEIVDETLEAIGKEGEKTEGMTKEEVEEYQKDVAEAERNVSGLCKDAKEFSKLSKGLRAIKAIAKFVGQQAAVASIFYGVTVLLQKMITLKGDSKNQDSIKKKQEVIKCILALIKEENDMSTKLLIWLTRHKDDRIKLGGMDILLEAIFEPYLEPIFCAVDKAFKVAKRLHKKIDGAVAWEVPNAGDIEELMDATKAFTDAFDKFKQFCDQNAEKFPVLMTLPLTQEDINTLSGHLNVVRNMPFY